MEQDTGTPAPGPESDASLASRLVSVMNQEEQTVEEAAPETPQPPVAEQAQTEELTPEDIPDEEAAAPSESGEVFEIVHNGQEHKLSREETIKYAQQGFDYTQKTQAVAEQARVLQERMQRWEQVEQVQDVLAGELASVKAFEAQLAPYKNIDWVKIATEEPLDYPKYRAQYDTLVQGWQAAQQQYQQKKGAVDQYVQKVKLDMLQQEAAQLPKAVKGWEDPAKLKAAMTEMRSYLEGLGMNPEQVSAKYLDSAFSMKTLWQSIQYEKLQRAKSDKVKQLRTAPPVVRPGATQSPVAPKVEQERKAMDRLRKTGDLNDAAAAYFARMK